MRHPADRLDAGPVRDTIARLEQRIAARFPDRDLRCVAGELLQLTDAVVADAEAASRQLRRARVASRVGVVLVLLLVLATGYLALSGQGSNGLENGLDWLSLVESGINDLVFAGIAVYFLGALPGRWQRARLIGLLHRLRSLAHIIDMHQLTKDPERLRPGFHRTAESPRMELDREGLQHYLDYCSEMISLVGKVAALCAEESTDPVVLDLVSTVETLTTGMAAKIWQKISLLPA